MIADETAPGLRWYGIGHAFGADDHGVVWPSALGPDLATGLTGAPMSWYTDASTQLHHVPTTPHMMAVHREHEVALVESAWTAPHGVLIVAHFYLPLSRRADAARRQLLAAEAEGSLSQWPFLSVMANVKYRVAGPLKQVTKIVKVDALDFVHRPGAEGRLIRSLAWDEDVCPMDSAARHFAEIEPDHVTQPQGDAA